jgi:hypothetical protein
MNNHFRSTAIYLALIAACACLVDAQVQTIYDSRKPIAPRSKIKYIDLVKLVFPDARVMKTNVHGFPYRRPTIEYRTEASSSIPVSNAFGAYESHALKRDLRIDRIESLRIYTEDGDRMLMLFSVLPILYLQGSQMDENGNPIANVSSPPPDAELDRSYVDILAVFRVDKGPRLIDAIDVRNPDRTVSVNIFAPLLVKTYQDGFLIHNRQKGLSDNFSAYSLFGLENGRLKLLFDEFPPLLYSNRCDSDIEDIATFWDSPVRRSNYRKISMRLTRTEKIHSTDCKRIVKTKVKTQLYSANWKDDLKSYSLYVEPARPALKKK